jgi:hypothetical protein
LPETLPQPASPNSRTGNNRQERWCFLELI